MGRSKIRVLDIPGYEGRYAAAEDGRIWSYFTRRWLKPFKRSRYFYVNLGAKNPHAIYRLCLLAFKGPPPPGRPWANHLDGDKNNNALSNLEWCSPSENAFHALAIGLRVPPRKILQEDIPKILEAYRSGKTQKELAREYGVGRATIQRVLKGTHGYHLQGKYL